METVKIELTVEQVNKVLNALGDQHKLVTDLIFHIKGQAEAQVTPPQPEPEQQTGSLNQ